MCVCVRVYRHLSIYPSISQPTKQLTNQPPCLQAKTRPTIFSTTFPARQRKRRLFGHDDHRPRRHGEIPVLPAPPPVLRHPLVLLHLHHPLAAALLQRKQGQRPVGRNRRLLRIRARDQCHQPLARMPRHLLRRPRHCRLRRIMGITRQ